MRPSRKIRKAQEKMAKYYRRAKQALQETPWAGPYDTNASSGLPLSSLEDIISYRFGQADLQSYFYLH